MPHELIKITEWPEMPAPLNSTTPGEAWIWGDFVITLQINPETIDDALQRLKVIQPTSLSAKEYPFAMSVFYRWDKSPHPPSVRPILVAALGRINYRTVAASSNPNDALRKLLISESDLSSDTVLFKDLYFAEIKHNYGIFDLPLTEENARKTLFEIIQPTLKLDGEPIKIGVISDIHGHPNTGWPTQQDSKTNRGGCLGVISFVGITMILLFLAY